MAAYISQSEAATYVEAVSTWSASQAGAYLTAASAMVETAEKLTGTVYAYITHVMNIFAV